VLSVLRYTDSDYPFGIFKRLLRKFIIDHCLAFESDVVYHKFSINAGRRSTSTGELSYQNAYFNSQSYPPVVCSGIVSDNMPLNNSLSEYSPRNTEFVVNHVRFKC
jgi:hypothetical protein